MTENLNQTLDEPLSIQDINMMKSGYNKLVKQNQDFQTAISNLKQAIDEKNAGILMIAQLLSCPGIENLKNDELIPNIAAWIEEFQDEFQQTKSRIKKKAEAIAKDGLLICPAKLKLECSKDCIYSPEEKQSCHKFLAQEIIKECK